jgi:hypothetical protein
MVPARPAADASAVDAHRLAANDDLDIGADGIAPLGAHQSRAAGDAHARATAVARVDAAAQPVGAADEAGDESVGGLAIDFVGRADLLHDALVEHADPVRHRQRLGLIVRDEQAGDPQRALQALDLELHLVAQRRVEIGERLVEQQDATAAARPRGRAPRAAAGRPRAGAASARRAARAAPAPAPHRRACATPRRARPGDAGRRRHCRRRKDEETAHRTGRPDRACACGPAAASRRPSISTCPPLGSMSPAIMRSTVVLPQPDGPSRAMNSPEAAVRSTPRTTGTSR